MGSDTGINTKPDEPGTDAMDLVEILMVEDNPGDALLTRAELEDAHVCNNLHVVPDAESALAFLRREGEFTDRPRPDLILLDLNLPGMGGSEFLSAIKSDSSFKEIPVAVLTSGGEHEAIVRKQSDQADVFVSKPVGLQQLVKIVEKVDGLSFGVVRNAPPS